MDCPILVWMLFTNRELTSEEYERCFRVMKECVPHSPVRNAPSDPETMRQMIAFLLPLLMMRHRRVPRSRWRDNITGVGKHWIEQIHHVENDNPVAYANRARSMIGYHTTYDHNLVGMAMTQGRKEDVVNIGVGIKEIVSPPGMTANDFAISLYHRLTPLEQSHIAPELGEEVVMRRLCVILALKQAYIKAIGQPLGFDWSRLEFNIPDKTATGDGRPLTGWEFRVWSSELGFPLQGETAAATAAAAAAASAAAAAGSEGHYSQHYQCAVAFFRRTRETRFVWHTDPKDLEAWVQFITLDQLLNVADKLVE